MVRLGHIDYSNCYPVHARLLEEGAPPGIEIHTGVPAELNRWLEEGRIDVAPASSIEVARHPDRYRVLRDFVIGSRGPVQSILLEGDLPPEALHGRVVAVPTASATSVVLLRILLERRLGVVPTYRRFDQAHEDPFAAGADAALWIGDTALRRGLRSDRPHLTDLGEAWWAWTGLPFAFALWIVSADASKDAELTALHASLLESRAYFEARLDELAMRRSDAFGVPASLLVSYWRSLCFELDEDMVRGALHFFRLAAELGEARPVEALRYV